MIQKWQRPLAWVGVRTIAWFLAWIGSLIIAQVWLGLPSLLLCWVCSGSLWNFRKTHDMFNAEYNRLFGKQNETL